MTSVIGLQLSNHGGMCCGIKSIWNFGNGPDSLTYPEFAREAAPAVNNNDRYFDVSPQNVSFFTDAAPAETRVERLDRFIEFVKKRRPSHIIEAVLANTASEFWQKAWVPVLEERGFKEVTSALNSNSDNVVTVYHLVIKKGEVVK